MTWKTAYTRLPPSELSARAARALELLSDCRLCPRDCGVDRLSDRWSACKTGRYAVVSSAFPHHGEEDCLRGQRGSGTIFFTHCNLRCVFCQNYDISQGQQPVAGRGTPPARLARLMLELQDRGCHNINFVTPEHVVPQILEALVPAVEGGLRLPLVYNTSAYDSLESLEGSDSLLFIGGRVRKRLDNKFILRCFDLNTGEMLWEVARIRLKGTGQEPGFFRAFVHGNIVVVNGL